MFKDVRAFSGFSTNDISKTKEFYSQTLAVCRREADPRLRSVVVD